MISEKNLKLEIKKTKEAIKILKKQNIHENYACIQLTHFLCRKLEGELKFMEDFVKDEYENT